MLTLSNLYVTSHMINYLNSILNNEFSVVRYSLGLNVFCIMYATFGKRTDLMFFPKKS